MKPPEKSSSSATSRGSSVVKNHKDFVRKLIAVTFSKLPQLVLQNRIVHGESAAPSSEPTKISEWFSIRCAELPWISELVQAWKKDQKPMNIFVFSDTQLPDGQEKVLLEHWQVVYTQKSNTILQGSDVKALYNKFIIMFRSLYIYLKVLPAYHVFRSHGSKLSYQLSPGVITSPFPFGAAKPEKVEIGRLDTPFGTVDVSVSYRKDVAFALSQPQEVIPAESIIPDYAPSLGSKLPIRTSTKPVSIQNQRTNSLGNVPAGPRGRSHTAVTARPPRATEAHSQPTLADHSRLSFSPPVVGATSMWTETRPGSAVQSASAGRDRQNSEPPFPSFNPSSVGAFSSSPRVTAFSVSPLGPDEMLMALPRSSSGADGERVLTAVSPPSFSQYEAALNEAPDPDFDGPVFSIEGSFAAGGGEELDVNSFVRFCQSRPVLMLIEDENKQFAKPEKVFSVKNV